MVSLSILLIDVENSKKNSALDELWKNFPNSDIQMIRVTQQTTKFLIKTNSDKTKGVVKHEIESIDGISSVTINTERKIPKLPIRYSLFLVIGLSIVWVFIAVSVFIMQGSLLNNLTNPQILVIEVSIGVSLSVWVFFHDRKTQRDVVDVLANINILTNEINQNVKDLAERDLKD